MGSFNILSLGMSTLLCTKLFCPKTKLRVLTGLIKLIGRIVRKPKCVVFSFSEDSERQSRNLTSLSVSDAENSFSAMKGGTPR